VRSYCDVLRDDRVSTITNLGGHAYLRFSTRCLPLVAAVIPAGDGVFEDVRAEVVTLPKPRSGGASRPTPCTWCGCVGVWAARR